MQPKPCLRPSQPVYSDNRSTPADVIQLLSNAIKRHEYLHRWSYYRPVSAPDYQIFAAGYAKPVRVDIRLGKVTPDGAAGSIHSQFPLALRATATNGTVTMIEGCYLLTQVQPTVQEVCPFRPTVIDKGHLQQSSKTFAKAMSTCTE